jgi:hypothetical protein
VKKLVDLPAGGMQHGTIVKIEDFTQDLEVDLNIYHKSEWEPKDGEDGQVEEEEQFKIGGDKPVAVKKDSTNGDKLVQRPRRMAMKMTTILKLWLTR